MPLVGMYLLYQAWSVLAVPEAIPDPGGGA